MKRSAIPRLLTLLSAVAFALPIAHAQADKGTAAPAAAMMSMMRS